MFSTLFCENTTGQFIYVLFVSDKDLKHLILFKILKQPDYCQAYSYNLQIMIKNLRVPIGPNSIFSIHVTNVVTISSKM